ncbi:MAG: threonylcarbamoyl-AMP synthase [Anaerolineae bacterium]|nr:threonylcarbamoyl-AMP synthase [Anaerolineae bacterium]MBL8107392.1 threonylcarbamoyl-AMP synthase [Anaerolineales bacterium]MCC7189159.1 threonylcarbamoyl-AMP synthase [Anaerolineales bacterium]
MKTKIVSANSPDAINLALDILKDGGLVAFPTDTVYGVGALVFDGKAIESIYTAKNRPIEKAIPVLIADADDMDKVGMDIPDIARRIAARFFPGPLTCIIPKQPTLPSAVSATATVGVRAPDHEVARSLLRAAGPMAVTSANISGQPSPSTAEEVFAQLNGRIPLIIDGGKTPGGVPSTVVDCASDEIKILREGPISLEEIKSKLSSSI